MKAGGRPVIFAPPAVRSDAHCCEHGFPFSQVKVYQDGLVGWERAGISMDK